MRRPLIALGRLMLSGIFVVAGWEAFKEPGSRPGKAAKLGISNPELAVRANGLGMIAAGVAFALGVKRRLSALALIGLLVPTTLAGHAFWEEEDPKARSSQRVQFLKNLGLIGGLVISLAAARRPKKKEKKKGSER